jgi:transcription initiation factor IIF auxiliary subunit
MSGPGVFKSHQAQLKVQKKYDKALDKEIKGLVHIDEKTMTSLKSDDIYKKTIEKLNELTIEKFSREFNDIRVNLGEAKAATKTAGDAQALQSGYSVTPKAHPAHPFINELKTEEKTKLKNAVEQKKEHVERRRAMFSGGRTRRRHRKSRSTRRR